MTRPAILSLNSPQERDDHVRFSVTWKEPEGDSQVLWWELPAQFADAVTPWADPWVIGLLFPAMQRDRPVHVEGRVSPSLLAGVETFMRVWRMWVPNGRYRPVEISVEAEEELPAPEMPDVSVSSYSCGVDSGFTVFRHKHKLAGRANRTIGAALVQHGFDVTLDQEKSNAIFSAILADAGAVLSEQQIPIIPLRGNFRRLQLDWTDAWGTQIISGLSLFSRRFGSALFPNDLPYDRLGSKPWPAHPLTNEMLRSRNFRVLDDGGEYSRTEKLKALTGWPVALDHLRVCYGVNAPGSHENCGYCEKCLRTLLGLRIAGAPKPSSFRVDIDDAAIRRVRLTGPTKVEAWEVLECSAAEAGLADESWARAISAVLRKQRRRKVRNRLQQPFVPIRDAVRRMTRGSALSRSEQKKREAGSSSNEAGVQRGGVLDHPGD